MEEVMKIISLLDDEDKQILSKFANTLIQKNKYSRLRKEIAYRRAEVEKGAVLSHKELWQDFEENV